MTSSQSWEAGQSTRVILSKSECTWTQQVGLGRPGGRLLLLKFAIDTARLARDVPRPQDGSRVVPKRFREAATTLFKIAFARRISQVRCSPPLLEGGGLQEFLVVRVTTPTLGPSRKRIWWRLGFEREFPNYTGVVIPTGVPVAEGRASVWCCKTIFSA